MLIFLFTASFLIVFTLLIIHATRPVEPAKDIIQKQNKIIEDVNQIKGALNETKAALQDFKNIYKQQDEEI